MSDSDSDPFGTITPLSQSTTAAFTKPVQDTPVGVNSSVSSTLLHGSLKQQREAIQMYIGGAVPEVDYDFFTKCIFPPSPVNIKQTMDALRNSGSLIDDGWTAFNGIAPVKYSKSEKHAFGQFEDIYSAIFQNCKFSSVERTDISPTPTLTFGTIPDIAPTSTLNVKSRPDACGLLNNNHELHTSRYIPADAPGGSRDYHWFDIAYTAEYKLANSRETRNDNWSKVLWSMHHAMNIDNRRRFTYGITVENTSTRIWFSCRQIILVSKAFNFMKEPEKLVQFVVSLHYADSVSLGYDPTVSHIWKDGGLQHEFLVCGKDAKSKTKAKTFVTTGCIVSDESANILSRATRVYEVYDKSDLKQTRVILKDSWIDAHRQREGDILSDILDGATAEEKSYFLTLLLHGVVRIGSEEDNTKDRMLGGFSIQASVPNLKSENPSTESLDQVQMATTLVLNEQAPAQFDSDSVDKISFDQLMLTSTNVLPGATADTDTPRFLILSPKVHYRIVFKEVGTSLHHHAHLAGIAVESMLMPTFCDIIQALNVMFKKGYIHRDITIANIVMYQGKAKLVDLEFAKKFGTTASSPIRTGSHSFIAGELLKEGHYFTSFKNDLGRNPSHNPLHDLESLWWIGIWCSFFLTPKSKLALGPLDAAAMEKIRFNQRTLFPSGVPVMAHIAERETLLIQRRLLRRYALLVTRFPKPLRKFFALLEYLRQSLVDHYSNAEEIQTPIDPDYFTSPGFISLYTDMEKKFSSSELMRRAASDDDCLLVLR